MWVEQLGGESETWCLPSVGSYLDHGPPSSSSSLLDPLFSWSNLTSSLGEQAEVGGISFSFHSDLQSHLLLPPLVLPGRASCLKEHWASIFLAVWISYLSVVSLCICMWCIQWVSVCLCELQRPKEDSRCFPLLLFAFCLETGSLVELEVCLFGCVDSDH